MQRDAVRLDDIRASCDDIAELTAGQTIEDFQSDRAVRYAVLHCLTVIGEASNQISDSLKLRYPDIPWRDIVNLRHRVVHDYSGLDYPLIWDVVTRMVTPLSQQVRQILEKDFPEDG